MSVTVAPAGRLPAVAEGVPDRALPGVASLAVAELLEAPPARAQVLGAFPAAAYLTVPAHPTPRVVALVGSAAVALPNAVVLSTAAETESLAGLRRAEAVVGGGQLRVGALGVTAVRWWTPRPKLAATQQSVLARGFRALADDHRVGPGEAGPDVASRVAVLAAAVRRRDASACLQAADDLIGLGPGLTPAGDDVVAGLLAGLRLLTAALSVQVPGPAALADRLEADVVSTAGARTTALSASLLMHAARGEVARPMALLLRALCGRGDPARAAHRLASVGHTSGRDLLTGLKLAAAAILPAPCLGRHPR